MSVKNVDRAIALIIFINDFNTIDEQTECIEALRKLRDKLEATK